MALSVTPTDEMKTLAVGEKIYEIVDDQAREDVSEIKTDFSQLPTDGVVANSKQLLSSNGADNTEPYMFRAVPVNADREEVNAVVGGTVAWNQVVKLTNKSAYGITFTVNESTGTVTINGTTTRNITRADYFSPIADMNIPANHKVYISGFDGHDKITLQYVGLNYQGPIYTLASETVRDLTYDLFKFSMVIASGTTFDNEVFTMPMIIDLTAMFGSTIADYIYNLERSTAGAGVAWFRKLFPADYYPYDAGTLKSVGGVSSHDMVGFNQWDEEWRNGYYNETTGEFISNSAYVANKNPIPALPNATYYGAEASSYVDGFLCYDADMHYLGMATRNTDGTRLTKPNTAYINFRARQAYGGTYKSDICINLSDPAKNGTYEPYVKHSYPLDSSLTLRGIPKLDSNNQLYYDGDTYESDGTVTRRYGIVDLGTLNWSKVDSDAENRHYFYASPGATAKGVSAGIIANGISTKYIAKLYGEVCGPNAVGYGFNIANTTHLIYVKDESHDSDDATTFKTAVSGVMLVYELVTPTTETADPYQSLQVCDPTGTEEFVSTGIVPVGHETRYPENLRAKIEGLPWDFSNLIAPTETGTASRNYTVGSLLIMGNVLYKVTANIANGGTITPGTNVTATTLSEVILALQ